jgi:hypothetical protein
MGELLATVRYRRYSAAKTDVCYFNAICAALDVSLKSSIIAVATRKPPTRRVTTPTASRMRRRGRSHSAMGSGMSDSRNILL